MLGMSDYNRQYRTHARIQARKTEGDAITFWLGERRRCRRCARERVKTNKPRSCARALAADVNGGSWARAHARWYLVCTGWSDAPEIVAQNIALMGSTFGVQCSEVAGRSLRRQTHASAQPTHKQCDTATRRHARTSSADRGEHCTRTHLAWSTVSNGAPALWPR